MLFAPYSDIRLNARVVHRSRGRGKVVHLYAGTTGAAVLFDGDRDAVRVELADLVPMPAGMPASVDGGQAVAS